jgi:hypothetical protein
LTKATAGCFCTWRRKWLTAKNLLEELFLAG